MFHRFSSDSSFSDAVLRLAETDASFAEGWSHIGPAILGGRPLNDTEHKGINRIIALHAADREARNASLSAPHVHTGEAETAGPVGIGHVSSQAEADITPAQDKAVLDESAPTPSEAVSDAPEAQNSDKPAEEIPKE